MNPSELGAHIRESREAKGTSLRKFAAEIGVSPTYLSKVETGAEKPAAPVVQRIAAALGLHSDELLGRAGKIAPDVLEIMLSDPVHWARTIREVTRLRKRLTGRKPADFSDCGVPHLVEG